ARVLKIGTRAFVGRVLRTPDASHLRPCVPAHFAVQSRHRLRLEVTTVEMVKGKRKAPERDGFDLPFEPVLTPAGRIRVETARPVSPGAVDESSGAAQGASEELDRIAKAFARGTGHGL